MPASGSGEVVSSSSLLLRDHPGRRQAETPLIAPVQKSRATSIPDVPTLKELGINVVYEVVRGILAPKGTPAPVRAKLEEACEKATKEPSFARAMKLQGTRVAFMNGKDYGQFLDKIDSENKTVMSELGLSKK